MPQPGGEFCQNKKMDLPIFASNFVECDKGVNKNVYVRNCMVQ